MGYLIVVLAAVLLIDLPPLIKNKNRRELIVFLVIFVLTAALSVLVALDIPMPSPLLVLDDLLKGIGLSY